MSQDDMTMILQEQMDAYALGFLEGAELRQVEALLAEDSEAGQVARQVLVQAQEALTTLLLTPEPPSAPPGLQARLWETVAQSCRLEEFVQPLAKMLDVASSRAREMLGWIDDLNMWEAAPVPSFSLMHLEPGPSVQAANVGSVKVLAGADFPHHTHDGEEIVFILQGGLRDSSGTISRRGDVVRAPDDSEHSFQALPGPDLIYLVLLERGVRFDFQIDL